MSNSRPLTQILNIKPACDLDPPRCSSVRLRCAVWLQEYLPYRFFGMLEKRLLRSMVFPIRSFRALSYPRNGWPIGVIDARNTVTAFPFGAEINFFRGLDGHDVALTRRRSQVQVLSEALSSAIPAVSLGRKINWRLFFLTNIFPSTGLDLFLVNCSHRVFCSSALHLWSSYS